MKMAVLVLSLAFWASGAWAQGCPTNPYIKPGEACPSVAPAVPPIPYPPPVAAPNPPPVAAPITSPATTNTQTDTVCGAWTSGTAKSGPREQPGKPIKFICDRNNRVVSVELAEDISAISDIRGQNNFLSYTSTRKANGSVARVWLRAERDATNRETLTGTARWSTPTGDDVWTLVLYR